MGGIFWTLSFWSYLTCVITGNGISIGLAFGNSHRLLPPDPGTIPVDWEGSFDILLGVNLLRLQTCTICTIDGVTLITLVSTAVLSATVEKLNIRTTPKQVQWAPNQSQFCEYCQRHRPERCHHCQVSLLVVQD